MKRAIYLSGGGARAAYQAGALKGILDIVKPGKIPVEIISSVSAGSINASLLAMHPDNFSFAVTRLIEIWSNLTSNQIFKTSNYSLMKSVLRNSLSMMFHMPMKEGGYLLDTSPLAQLLDSNLSFRRINENISKGLLSAFEVAASCYDFPVTASFFNATDTKLYAQEIRGVSYPTQIECDHILASCAIPLFFPSIKINNLFFGDGGMHLISPLRAAIRLGAEQILIIGTRKTPSIDFSTYPGLTDGISFAVELGNMLSALFLDNLDKDLEVLSKINTILGLVPAEKKNHERWKKIKYLYIRPTRNLSELTENKLNVLPYLLRHLLDSFGKKEQAGNLMSFLLFESVYCKELISIGYEDAMMQKNSIEEFFSN
jgi:NTE family protein